MSASLLLPRTPPRSGCLQRRETADLPPRTGLISRQTTARNAFKWEGGSKPPRLRSIERTWPLCHTILVSSLVNRDALFERPPAMRMLAVPSRSRRERILDGLSDFGTVVGYGLLILVILAIPAVSSILAYHWVDRPDNYVDGRWFTLGCIAFWMLVGGQANSSRD